VNSAILIMGYTRMFYSSHDKQSTSKSRGGPFTVSYSTYAKSSTCSSFSIAKTREGGLNKSYSSGNQGSRYTSYSTGRNGVRV